MQTIAHNLSLQYSQKLNDLFKLASLFGYDSHEAVKCSQELDKIVFEIQKMDTYPFI